jgi:hypothetical protein
MSGPLLITTKETKSQESTGARDYFPANPQPVTRNKIKFLSDEEPGIFFTIDYLGKKI